MFDRSPLDWRSTKREDGEDDRGGRMDGSKGERLRGCKRKKRGDLGGGVLWRRKRGKEVQGRKRRRGLIKGKGDLGDQSKGKGNLDQRGHWKKKEKVFGEGGGFPRIKIIKASWTRVLFDD